MTLKDFLVSTKTPAAQLAKVLGISVISVHRYITGVRMPTKAILRRIVDATNGAVQPNDFY